MKQTSLLFVFFCWGLGAWGQKSDYVWLSGYDSYGGYDTGWGFKFGATVLDFNFSPRQVSYDSIAMNFEATNTSFCDSNGNLLFYTNSVYIANSLNAKIENSDSLNAGIDFSDIEGYGNRQPQGIIAFPLASLPNQYFLIHTFKDVVGGILTPTNILLTRLDMSANVGHGRVLFKNKVLENDRTGGCLAAAKHGNGKDWWVLALKPTTNCFYTILLGDSVISIDTLGNCNGVVYPYTGNNYYNASCFSPDGTKFAYLAPYAGLNIYDFDRCTGRLSNPVNIPMPLITDSSFKAYGISISPNNRFLYAGITLHMYQYDLWANDIPGSADTIADYDNWIAPFPSVFHTQQLGPDGKIYISCANGDTVYHVIERPDEKGDSCLVKQHSLSLPTPSLGVPSFPNYRLGALPGSPCDTLSGLSETARAEKEKILKVFPNPATDVVTVDYGFTDWNKGGVRLEIINELGQVVHQQRLPMYSGFQKIEVGGFAAGVYQVAVKRGNGVVGVSKFTKQ